eukprot:TRINITY_DN34840_c0_g1_i1.p1 TRINITY_DN34840_c0_g1~~TRINITY_DN34840_c0_g1_i1.p1  ORF type:complete len:204 (+),score=23.51 TRINITY_DN34840_c0_g1_i1:102-713(+)
MAREVKSRSRSRTQSPPAVSDSDCRNENDTGKLEPLPNVCTSSSDALGMPSSPGRSNDSMSPKSSPDEGSDEFKPRSGSLRSKSTPPPSRSRQQLWGVKLQPLKDAPTVPEGQEELVTSECFMHRQGTRGALASIDQSHTVPIGNQVKPDPLTKPLPAHQSLQPLDTSTCNAIPDTRDSDPFATSNLQSSKKLPRLTDVSTPR